MQKQQDFSAKPLACISQDQSKPDCDRLLTLALFFGVSTDWLLGRVEERTPDITKQAAIEHYGLSERVLTVLECMQEPFYEDEWIWPGEMASAIDALFSSQTGLDILNSIARYLSPDLAFSDGDGTEIMNGLQCKVINVTSCGNPLKHMLTIDAIRGFERQGVHDGLLILREELEGKREPKPYFKAFAKNPDGSKTLTGRRD